MNLKELLGEELHAVVGELGTSTGCSLSLMGRYLKQKFDDLNEERKNYKDRSTSSINSWAACRSSSRTTRGPRPPSSS